MIVMTLPEILRVACEIRRNVEPYFWPEGSEQGVSDSTPSSGYCAAVSVLTHARLGGDFVSAIVDSGSHWFNRIETIDGTIDIDLTADQFGRDPIAVDAAGQLYEGTRVRADRELNIETLQRALILARRADMHDVAAHLQRILDQKAVAIAS
jgi:hypothetical protein